MTKQALQRYVQGPLVMLRKACYALSIPVENVTYKECGYHQWTRIKEKDGFSPYDPNHGFGGREYHAIFRTDLVIPPTWEDHQVRLRVTTGADDIWNNDNPQFFLYLNGVLTCGLDVRHIEADLPKENEIQLSLYTYVNAHKSDVFLDLTLYAVNEELEALAYDLSLAYETALTIEEQSEAFVYLSEACQKTIQTIDFSSKEALRDKPMLQNARARLASLLAEYAPRTHQNIALCGHSHIDMAWLWTLDQTREKSIRSYSTVLYLMDRYPHYCFSSSQMQMLAFLKEDYPSLFAQIKKRINEGRWEVEGSMWIESDTILTSGESLARQIYWGKRWAKEELGVNQKILWLVDCFGFPATLPQIMKQTNISYFVTTKMGWNESNRMPHDVFSWKGLDGSEVLAYFVSCKDYESIASYPKSLSNETSYNGLLNPSQLLGTWQRFSDKEKTDTLLYLYGYGDGGGGPTKEMLEYEQRLCDGYPGLPKVHTSTALPFFKQLETKASSLASWYGELYLEYHRGTYTTMAEIKKLNRMGEQKAMEAEFLASLRYCLDTEKLYPHSRFEQAWKLLLLNQFHDILPGSAIAEVYTLSKKQLCKVVSEFDSQMQIDREWLASHIAKQAEDLVIFNTLSHERTDIAVLADTPYTAALDEDEKPLAVHREGSKLHILCPSIPPKGYRCFKLGHQEQKAENPFALDGHRLSTPFYEVSFSSDGSLDRIFDKTEQREVLVQGQKANVLKLTVDYPKDYDAWNIGKQRDMEYVLDNESVFEVISKNELFCTLQWSQKWGKSTFVRRTTFFAHTNRIDFSLDVDFHEDHLMLRTIFFVDVFSPKASFDIAYGVCERSTHNNTSWDEARFEVPAHKWVDLSEESYGVSLISKQSYGYQAKGNMLSLSLLRSPSYPNENADRGFHHFDYALYPHNGRYQEAKVIEQGYALQHQLIAHCPVQQKGTLAPQYSLVSLDNEDLVIETIKKSEDRNSILVRVLELKGRRTKALLSTPLDFEDAYCCNLLEERQEKCSITQNKVTFTMRPYQIQTVELVLRR